MDKIRIFDIQHFSLYDGPGIRTVVFFKGCPLDCAWCHNPESKSTERELSYLSHNCVFCSKCASVCPNDAHTVVPGKHTINRTLCTLCGKCTEACNYSALKLLGKEYTVEEVIAELKRDDMFYTNGGGVTISGGEPFMQFEGLYALIKRCKEENYSVCVETSGFTAGENLAKASKYVDLFLYDYKLTCKAKHKKYVGAGNKIIIDNLSVLDKVGAKVVLRCPIIPDINDTEEHFEAIARLSNEHKCIIHIEFMPYHPLGISKSEQIGRECLYNESEFLSKDIVASYAKKTQKLTEKKVIVSG